MFMFWSKRTVLTKRLLKAKVRGEHETECEAQENLFISNGNSTELRGSCCFSVGNTVDGCDNTSSGTSETRTRSSNDCSPHHNRNRNDSAASNSTTANKRDKDNVVVDSESSRIVRLKELLKTLKENQLEMLLTAVESYGADLSTCVLVPRRSGGRNPTNDDNNDDDRVPNENLDNEPYSTAMSSSSSPLPHQRDLNRHANCFNHHQHHHHRTRHHLYHHHHHRQLLLERQQQQQQQQQRQRQRESSSLAFEERLAASPANDVTTDTPATANNRHGWSDRGRGKSFSSVFGPAPTSNATTDLSHLDPHLLCCQIWRWPDLVQSSELKRLPVCHSAKDPVYVCCNPYHWSRLCKPESPPPPYCLNADRLRPEDRAPSERDSHGQANINAHEPFPGSLTTNDEGVTGQREWCTLAYWELGGRVGRLYPVEPDTVNVFDSLLDGDGLCLANLAENHATSAAVQRTRNKIGLGLMLSQESDGVWAYNRSENPIFVNSPTLDDPESRTLLVYRVPPGFCLNIFDRTKSMQLPHNSTTTMPTGLESSGPVDVNSVRISFAKGWGPKYSRQEVTSCPCWLEVLLAPCR